MNIMLYTVKSGDTLFKIAKEHKTTVDELAKLNGVVFPNDIYPNMTLKIPVDKPVESKWYVVRPGDTLFFISKQFDTTVDNLVNNNNIPDKDLIYPGQILRIT